MIKRHCDLCDSVIGDYTSRYKLVKVNAQLFCFTDKEKELELCEKCLNKIIERIDKQL